jgi:hypothetical protein
MEEDEGALELETEAGAATDALGPAVPDATAAAAAAAADDDDDEVPAATAEAAANNAPSSATRLACEPSRASACRRAERMGAGPRRSSPLER